MDGMGEGGCVYIRRHLIFSFLGGGRGGSLLLTCIFPLFPFFLFPFFFPCIRWIVRLVENGQEKKSTTIEVRVR